MHVVLEDMRYQSVVESHLNHALNGFGVETAEDHDLLSKVLTHFRCHKNTIYKYKLNSSFDYSSGCPDKSLRTMLDILKIDNEVVLQQFIIQGKIESTVLVADHREGDAILSRGYPANTSRILTADCFEVGSRRGGLSQTPMNRYDGPPRLRNDFDQMILETDAELADKRRRYQAIKDQSERLAQELEQLRNDKALAARRRSAAQKSIGDHKGKIESIRQQLQDQTVSQLPTYMALCEAAKETIVKLEAQKVSCEISYQQSWQEYQALALKVKELREQLALEKNVLGNIQKELQDFNFKVQELKEHLRHSTLKKIENQKKLDESKLQVSTI
ncbi:Structural maintenance of chromosomes protein 6, partial [Kappamyces sp. JEL0680]